MSWRTLHLPFSTPHFPGEALFSHLGRLLRAGGYAHASEFAALVTGKSGRRISLSLPCHLEWIGHSVSGLQDYSCEDLVNMFTVAPLYRPFISPERWNAVVASLRGHGTRDARMLLGIARGGGGDKMKPIHCPACIEEQCEQFGMPYWLVVFTLPYVTACPRHKLKLQPIEPSSNVRLGRFGLFGAPRALDTTPRIEVAYSQFRLAALATDLHTARLPALDPALVARAYRVRLEQEGLTFSGGRVRLVKLRARLADEWAGLDLGGSFRSPRWLYDMYLQDGCRPRSPLHHLILIGALFASFEDWVAALAREQPSVRRTRPPEYRGTRRVQLAPWLSEGAPTDAVVAARLSPGEQQLLRQGMPVRDVAAASGRSRYAVYRAIHGDQAAAEEWARAALAAEAAARKVGPADSPSPHRPRKDTRWLRRHVDALELLKPVPLEEPRATATPPEAEGGQ